MFNNTKIMLDIIQQNSKTIEQLTKETRLLNDIRVNANEEIKNLKDEIARLRPNQKDVSEIMSYYMEDISCILENKDFDNVEMLFHIEAVTEKFKKFILERD